MLNILVETALIDQPICKNIECYSLVTCRHNLFNFNETKCQVQAGILPGILASRMTRNHQHSGEISGEKAYRLIFEPE